MLISILIGLWYAGPANLTCLWGTGAWQLTVSGHLDPFDHLYGDYSPWCGLDAYRYWRPRRGGTCSAAGKRPPGGGGGEAGGRVLGCRDLRAAAGTGPSQAPVHGLPLLAGPPALWQHGGTPGWSAS